MIPDETDGNESNQQSSDLIVVAGDIFDNEYDALDDPDQLVKIFRQLKSQYGVYAVYAVYEIMILMKRFLQDLHLAAVGRKGQRSKNG